MCDIYVTSGQSVSHIGHVDSLSVSNIGHVFDFGCSCFVLLAESVHVLFLFTFCSF